MKLVYGIMALLMVATTTTAQENKTDKKDKKGMTINIGPDGISVEDKNKPPKIEKDLAVEFGVLDLGINSLKNNSVIRTGIPFNGTGFYNVPTNMQNQNLFDLRTGKSLNVNIWPVMAKLKLLKTNGQKIYLSTGIGLQIYNFRWSKPITLVNETEPQVVQLADSIHYTKNKLVVNYLSIPLQLTFKTKMASKLWLVYGFGVTGGYRIGSWTKQVSDEFGKQKNHDSFNLSDFNGCLTAEFGLDNYFRLYATYQLTNMYDGTYGVDQHPFSIGLRFGGI